MPIQAPNVDQILRLADDFGMDLTLDDAHSFEDLGHGVLPYAFHSGGRPVS